MFLQANEQSRDYFYLSIILITLLFVSCFRLFDNTLGAPDADRLLMDGVFFYDFFRDILFGNVAPKNAVDYTIQYYGQYPALSLGYKPFFLPLLIAVCISIFGIQVWVSKIPAIIISVFAFYLFYKVIKRQFNQNISLYSSVILLTTPFVNVWYNYSMTEISALSLVLTSGCFFYFYHNTSQQKYLYASSIALILAMWTKQTSAVLLLWVAIYILLENKFLVYLKKKEVYINILLISVFFLPLLAMTIYLGGKNLEQSVMTNHEAPFFSALKYYDYFIFLWKDQLTKPLFFVSLLGVVLALVKKDRRFNFLLSLFFATYIFFTFLNHHIARYTIFWIPFFALCAGYAVHYVIESRLKLIKMAGFAILITVIGYNLFISVTKLPTYYKGMEELAVFLTENTQSNIIFQDLYHDGYLIFNIRKHDPERKFWILRGDKTLSKTQIDFESDKYEELLNNGEEILSLFDQFGVDLIAVESFNLTNKRIHELLRAMLKDETHFELLTKIPTDSSNSNYKNQFFLVYRYKNFNNSSKERTINMPLPIINRDIQIKIQ